MEPKGVIAETLQAQGSIKISCIKLWPLPNLGKCFGKQFEWLVI